MAHHDPRELILAGSAGALGLTLPLAVHFLGSGPVLLPMHLPLVAAGFLVSLPLALWLVLLTPLLSSLLTGMPPLLPTVPLMVVELAAACLAANLLYRRLRAHLLLSVSLALLAGIAAGALATLVLVAGAAAIGIDLPGRLAVAAKILTALPGYGVQLLGLPLCVMAVEGRREESLAAGE